MLSILSILLLGPLLSGMYLSHRYNTYLPIFAAEGIEIKIQHYKRGWFRSEASVRIHFDNRKLNIFLKEQGINFSPPDFILHQYIEHGPIFYNAHSSHFGLASIQNELQNNKALSAWFKTWGIKPFGIVHHDVITFTGKYLKNITLLHVHLFYSKLNLHVKMREIACQLAFAPGNKNVRGSFTLEEISLRDLTHTIVIPSITTSFDSTQGEKNRKIGSARLSIPKFILQDANGDSLKLIDINFTGETEEKNQELSLRREFSIKKLQLNNLILGPLQLEAHIQKLNIEAIKNMVDAYYAIKMRGELYEAQLQKRLLSLLPNIVNPGTHFTLDKFAIKTIEGNVNVGAALVWPKDARPPDSLEEILQTADTTLELRISKKLTTKLLQVFSDMYSFYYPPPVVRENYNRIRAEIMDMRRQNALLLENLVNEANLLKPDAFKLLSLQKRRASAVEYNGEIKKIFLEKNISLATSYQLAWQYAKLLQLNANFKKIIATNKIFFLNQAEQQIKMLLDKNYMEDDGKEYYLKVTHEGESWKMNNRKILP